MATRLATPDLEESKMKFKEFVIETAAWQKKSGKNKNGGLNKKGVASYRREHPGSKLKTAVTTKPSKLKKGSKASKRRKSFCARMKGMKKHRTGAKTAHDPNSRINKSLRKWHCESVEELRQLLENAEQFVNHRLNEAKIIDPKYVNLYLKLNKPDAKPIRVGKNIPARAIDAVINKLVTKYRNVEEDMFFYTPGQAPKQ